MCLWRWGGLVAVQVALRLWYVKSVGALLAKTLASRMTGSPCRTSVTADSTSMLATVALHSLV